MVEAKKYYLPPTPLIPNSPYPLLHYPGFLSKQTDLTPQAVHDLFLDNGWQVQWIFRYGETQDSHYHSATHECMAVLSGNATIRFGVADTVSDLEESTYGSGKEDGGIELQAQAGDVFVLPAGLAHKTFATRPEAEFALLTPGDGHHVAAKNANVRDVLADIELSGFTMIGAYPTEGGEWNFARGGDDAGKYDKVWKVAKPRCDPVLGTAHEGLCGQWHEKNNSSKL